MGIISACKMGIPHYSAGLVNYVTLLFSTDMINNYKVQTGRFV